ncbi:MAG: hypothetical protein E7589_08200 [Ruminococcaceae bacterium]|nr:hypothetical protein [Oscillospiraceae bacterium]
MQRIEALREAALSCRHDKTELFYRFFKAYGETDQSYGADLMRYANAFYEAFSTLTPCITAGELIVGRLENRLSQTEQEEWESKYKAIATEGWRRAGGGQDSHMAVDYDLLLSKGISGVMEDIDGYLSVCTDDKKDFYNACKVSLAAVLKHSENYAKAAEELAASVADAQRKAELLHIADMCRRVPANPATGFYEAVQSVHFLTHCITLWPLKGHQQFQLGRLDRYLAKYYDADIAAGKITREEAQLILDCLGIQINMRVPSGLSSGYMVGGRDADGNVVANDLTEMCMQVIDDIRLVYPSVGLCYTSETPDKYLKKACEILSHGRSHPAIFNDDIISKGLRGYGVSERESHAYIHSTCVEITPEAASNVWVASPYTNMAQLLLDTMTQEYDSFEAHLDAILSRLDTIIKANFEDQNRMRSMREKTSANPILSCFVNDCLARGLDIERGGARYNWVMPSFVGMANFVDSLYAVKHIVYDTKEMTMSELKAILDNNFEGNESLRLRLLNTLPKYGNDNDEIDAYFGMMTDHIVAECKKYNGDFPEARLIPSVFCWIMHEWFGSRTGATPDGRVANFPLGDGSGPCQGREMKGPTASILSSTKWKHHELIGGVAVNMKFSKSSLGSSSIDVMMGLVRAYMERGGFEMQINVTDKSVLEAARRSPEQYRDLVVRIGGYSDYFTRLSPRMQDEVILRTEHKI